MDDGERKGMVDVFWSRRAVLLDGLLHPIVAAQIVALLRNYGVMIREEHMPEDDELAAR